jgi:lipopolysaccharide/colanic/teichoic acid biosynthesis glycosyltransferase
MVSTPVAQRVGEREEVEVDFLRRFDPLAVGPLVRADPAYHLAKRAVDLILASVSLVMLSPLMLFIAILIRLDSRGPALFRQRRVGGRRWAHGGYAYWRRADFTCYKFRSMVQDADPQVHRAFIEGLIDGQVEASASGRAKFKLTQDPRVTRVGQFLRNTSLDELPQLINVVRGEMSLVGPRPDLPYAVEMYQPGWQERLACLPGITGLWQVQGRGDLSYVDMMHIDVEYARQRSFWLDLKLLVLTVPAVLSRRGAA